ncbi:hypothetical protein OF83DRAFT_1120481 [Amylostereum chailletii]|nr:hypothetical protein OF83DRAFT_1120481 [Amylostereum chailletii]
MDDAKVVPVSDDATKEWAPDDILDPGVPFRVLILGRANAGKTTVLERLCKGSVEDARIYRYGELTDQRMMKGEQGRGEHEIDDEIVFPSLPGFVFHDSRGIEAGSVNELTMVQEFVSYRSESVKDKKSQLHAIWICLPIDTDRPLLPPEKDLCKLKSNGIPIIAIFTKADARRTKIAVGLKDGSGPQAVKKAKVEAAKHVDRLIQDLREQLPPAGENRDYETAPDLQKKDDKKCEEFCQKLISKTQALLPSSKMQALLVTVWRNNISARSHWVFRSLLEKIHYGYRADEIAKTTVARLVATFLPISYHEVTLTTPTSHARPSRKWVCAPQYPWWTTDRTVAWLAFS